MSEAVVVAETLHTTLNLAREGAARRLFRRPLAIASIIVIAVAVAVAIFAEWLAPYSMQDLDLSLSNAPVGSEYLLGGDRNGRDILSRLIYGTRVAVEAILIATSVAMLLGVVGGLVAGYHGKAVDAVTSWISNILIAIPAVILLVALYAAIGASATVAMLVLGVILAPNFFRLVRALTIAVKNESYVDAARLAGLSNLRIIGRHVLYAVRGPIIIQATFAAGVAVSLQTGLELLGLGDPSVPSWGSMMADAFANVFIAPIQLLWPSLALSLLVSALVLLGNELRDTLEGSTPPALRPPKGRLAATTEVVAESDPRPALEVRDLSVQYATSGGAKRTVVNNISIHVGRGEVVGLVGESGSGKTQTAFAILDLLPDAANVSGGAMTLRLKRKPRRSGRSALLGSSLAYIAQEPMSNLDPSFTVGSQLVQAIRASTRLRKRARRDRPLHLVTRVGIVDAPGTMKLYPYQVSGGMAQRILIAGAVAGEPDILIADEPTTALDVTIQAEVLELLRGLQEELGMSVLLVTHNFGVVADICDRVVVMRNGEVVETGNTLDVFDRPQHPYTQKLLGAILDVHQVREPRSEGTLA